MNTIYQAEEEWESATRSALFVTLDAAKSSYGRPDPFSDSEKVDVNGERILEWERHGDEFRIMAIHYLEGGQWICRKLGEDGGPLELG